MIWLNRFPELKKKHQGFNWNVKSLHQIKHWVKNYNFLNDITTAPYHNTINICFVLEKYVNGLNTFKETKLLKNEWNFETTAWLGWWEATENVQSLFLKLFQKSGFFPTEVEFAIFKMK